MLRFKLIITAVPYRMHPAAESIKGHGGGGRVLFESTASECAFSFICWIIPGLAGYNYNPPPFLPTTDVIIIKANNNMIDNMSKLEIGSPWSKHNLHTHLRNSQFASASNWNRIQNLFHISLCPTSVLLYYPILYCIILYVFNSCMFLYHSFTCICSI